MKNRINFPWTASLLGLGYLFCDHKILQLQSQAINTSRYNTMRNVMFYGLIVGSFMSSLRVFNILMTRATERALVELQDEEISQGDTNKRE